jgi:hypothetical protein
VILENIRALLTITRALHHLLIQVQAQTLHLQILAPALLPQVLAQILAQIQAQVQAVQIRAQVQAVQIQAHAQAARPHHLIQAQAQTLVPALHLIRHRLVQAVRPHRLIQVAARAQAHHPHQATLVAHQALHQTVALVVQIVQARLTLVPHAQAVRLRHLIQAQAQTLVLLALHLTHHPLVQAVRPHHLIRAQAQVQVPIPAQAPIRHLLVQAAHHRRIQVAAQVLVRIPPALRHPVIRVALQARLTVQAVVQVVRVRQIQVVPHRVVMKMSERINQVER